MIISLKDGLKFISVAVVAFCAVLVCSLFVNYAIDLSALDQTGFSPAQISMYKGQMTSSKVVCGASGGSLTLMAVVTLLFYVKRYIDTHARELGILKALGWSDFKIARSFAVFGLCVFVGCALGYGASWTLMPGLYRQNASEMFPEVVMRFHIVVPLTMVILPAILFSFIACLNAYLTLRAPVMQIMRGKVREIRFKEGKAEREKSFKVALALSVLKSKKTLAFFIFFGAWCFAVIQMSLQMIDLASEMMAIMMFTIVVVLGCLCLFLAMSSCMRDNEQTVALMRAFGYKKRERFLSVTAIYAPFALVGFAFGTVYQFAILKIMVDLVFSEFDAVYEFDVAACFITFAAFVVFYVAVTAALFMVTDKKKLKVEV